jgi:Predicted transcriptional regulators containing the CopG/Arc/MetJ DNA-binding domain and a metal-binding domain
MTKSTRFSTTFPPELIEDFDAITQKIGYESRSKALQDVIKLFVTERRGIQQKEDQSEQAGVILIIYDPDTNGLADILTKTLHRSRSLATSSMHVHITEKECMEIIAVKGITSEIRRLSNELATRRGVKILKTIIITATT